MQILSGPATVSGELLCRIPLDKVCVNEGTGEKMSLPVTGFMLVYLRRGKAVQIRESGDLLSVMSGVFSEKCTCRIKV